MATKVSMHVRLLRLEAIVLRFLGGFPYSWDNHNATGGAVFPSLKRRKGIQLGPYCFALIYMISIVLPLVTLYPQQADDLEFGLTYSVFIRIYQVTEALGAMCLYVHIWVKKHDLFALISYLNNNFPDSIMRDWKIKLDKGLMIHILIYFIYTASLFHYAGDQFLNASELLYKLTWVLRGILFYLYVPCNMAITTTSYLIMGVLETALADTIKDMKIDKAKHDQGTHENNGTQWTDGNISTTLHRVSTIAELDGRSQPRGFGEVMNDNFRSSRKSNLTEMAEVQAACHQVYKIQECQLLMNQYFSFPALALMAVSIIWIIADTYFTIIQGNWLDVILFVPNNLYNLSNIAVFCWPADRVMAKVSKNLII